MLHKNFDLRLLRWSAPANTEGPVVTKIVLFQHWVGNSVEVHLDKGLEQLDPNDLVTLPLA